MWFKEMMEDDFVWIHDDKIGAVIDQVQNELETLMVPGVSIPMEGLEELRGFNVEEGCFPIVGFVVKFGEVSVDEFDALEEFHIVWCFQTELVIVINNISFIGDT